MYRGSGSLHSLYRLASQTPTAPEANSKTTTPASSPAMTGFSLRRIRVHARDLAAQVAKRVDEVDARFVDQQTRHRAKIGLTGQVGVIAPAVAHPHAKGQRMKLARRSCLPYSKLS